ncbi:bifunctional 2-polyprenyl-6-hydroxyphenol methylase/3-demethylubiquinol 3-O-methyltransferase UbiG [Granulosicoccaceae sp. 1_MG-2023]|nr:bifunctional 2-polyprenyl-6-hydroxyphenol methylase/3-demethylubiquinol 3-O-methyltransferase UbiG [Granulosicoccaceae sp. 1_MG-2023]
MNSAESNVDPAEIAKFSDLAHQWWDKNSEFKPLHEINPLRVDYVKRFTSLQGKRLLDVGCGGGIFSEGLAREGADVTGIDLAEASLNVAELHALEAGLPVSYQQISVEELAAREPGSFDVVTCMEMLEHVPDPASVVRSCAALCKPGGYVFFSTLNRNPKAWLMAIAGAEYVLKLLPKGTHEFKRFIRPSELSGFARQGSLQTLDLTGMSYNPLSKQYKLGKDIDVNYLMACRKP